jgi:hypothetical protein
MPADKPEAPLYRVAYGYRGPRRSHKFTLLQPAKSPEAAIKSVRERMELDGMPMDRITITGATLDALT